MKSQDEEWLLKEKYNGEKTEGFFTDCKQLALGEPLAYLIGHAPFLDCIIYLEGRPLIPRVETEFWVEKAIEMIRTKNQNQPTLDGASEPTRVLDLCAGSGCIGVAIAKHIPNALIDFGEIDAKLVPNIVKNITENVEDKSRCTTYHSNLFEAIPKSHRYDFILTNPPYIDPALNRVDQSVKDFESHLALFGGKQGTEIIEQLIATAGERLSLDGQLWIEHEPEQVGILATLAHQHNFSITHHPDQYDVIRYSILVVK